MSDNENSECSLEHSKLNSNMFWRFFLRLQWIRVTSAKCLDVWRLIFYSVVLILNVFNHAQEKILLRYSDKLLLVFFLYFDLYSVGIFINGTSHLRKSTILKRHVCDRYHCPASHFGYLVIFSTLICLALAFL